MEENRLLVESGLHFELKIFYTLEKARLWEEGSVRSCGVGTEHPLLIVVGGTGSP